MRPSFQVPVTTSAPLVLVRTTDLQPVPMIVKSVSTPWMPYQNRSGWCFSMGQGPYARQPRTSPTFSLLRMPAMPLLKRNDELEKTGTLYFFAR